MTAWFAWALLLFVQAGPAQSPDSLAEQALASAQQGDGAGAAKLWQQALAQNPKHYAALFNYGVFLHRSGQAKEAVEYLERAAAVQPGYQVHLLRGMNYQQLERREEAIRAWRAALALQPRNLKLMQVLSVEYSRGRYFREAGAMARQALKIAPEEEALYLMAIKADQDAGDTNAAAELAAEAARRFPQSARAQFEHGYHLQTKGNATAAMQHLQRAMELDARYEEPFFFYGDLLVKQSQWEAAVTPLRKALEIRPEYSPARVALARALMNLEKLGEAVTELEVAARLDPRNAQPWVMLSQIYFRMGKEDEARAAKETSLRLRRENPGVLDAAQTRPFPAAEK